MDRRGALKGITAILGGIISAPLASAILSGCRVGPETPGWAPQTLTTAQNELVAALTEVIIPATDTPGARAARVNEFVDLMLTHWYPPEAQARFVESLADVDARAVAAHGVPFAEATPEQQHTVVAALEADALAGRGAPAGAPPFFQTIKGLTVAGYYTSEVGATQELQYQVAFPTYEGSVPLDEVGRTWA